MTRHYNASAPTPFIEANALLAVQNGEPDVAREKLLTMRDSELIDLENACADLGKLCFSIRCQGLNKPPGANR